MEAEEKKKAKEILEELSETHENGNVRVERTIHDSAVVEKINELIGESEMRNVEWIDNMLIMREVPGLTHESAVQIVTGTIVMAIVNSNLVCLRGSADLELNVTDPTTNTTRRVTKQPDQYTEDRLGAHHGVVFEIARGNEDLNVLHNEMRNYYHSQFQFHAGVGLKIFVDPPNRTITGTFLYYDYHLMRQNNNNIDCVPEIYPFYLQGNMPDPGNQAVDTFCQQFNPVLNRNDLTPNDMFTIPLNYITAGLQNPPQGTRDFELDVGTLLNSFVNGLNDHLAGNSWIV